MHPTQRKLMKRIILFLSLLFCIACPAIAGQDIDLVANVKNSTCKSGISNQGNIDLGVVGVGYFSGNVTPESYQPGGKEFTITVSDCALQGTGDVLNQLHIDFRALSGVMAAGSRQIFAKEGANKQVISSQVDSLIKISRIWADFFPANTSNQPI
ncbi:putative fimbrial-like adhesin protein [Escherichia coli]|nr:putative fimbrial-like adhesin protein [Escherichia coli]SQN98781.1 putative fimbrial-like adhesin protein [Escherichia coli]SQO01314.1 putative fimbrial-like adhesin protein [Escherichia coli]